MGLVLAIGLVPLLVGAAFIERQETWRDHDSLDELLTRSAASQAEALENHFESSRAVVRVAALNPAGKLSDLRGLYPQSVVSVCIVSGAPGRAPTTCSPRSRHSLGGPAGTSTHGPDALEPGDVHQSRPYISGRKREWVIAYSSPMPQQGDRTLQVEMSVESVRRAVAQSNPSYAVTLVDGRTGAAVLDSRWPQQAGAQLGDPQDSRFEPIAASQQSIGVRDLADGRVAFQRLQRSRANTNDWYVVVTSEAASSWTLDRVLIPLGVMIAALMIVGICTARHWTNVRFARLAGRMERAGEARIDAIVRNSSDMVTVVSRDGTVLLQTGAAEETLGYPAEDLVGTSFFELVHPEDRAVAASLHSDMFEAATGRHLEWRLRHEDGSWRHVETAAFPMSEDDEVVGGVLTTRDIGTRKALEEQLRHRAFHDPLTQLPNRALFYDRLDHALARDQRTAALAGVVFVDLDDFKLINDRFGHAGGDELLIAASQRLCASLRSADTVARLGGDEFGVLLEGVDGKADAIATAERILEAFREPFALRGEQVAIRPSLGIALGECQSAVAEDVLSRADLAMYAAKRRGKGCYQLFDGELAGEMLERLDPQHAQSDPDRITWFVRSEEQREEVASLLAAPERIRTVFQPLVDLRTGTVAGYEALSRIDADNLRPPNAWFAQAARCGFGELLECKAVEIAIRAAAERPDGTYVSVNVSPSTLMADAIQYVLPGDLTGIVFEVTENEVLYGGERLAAVIVALRARGGKIAIDDAGAGYAGLTHLTMLRPDIVKLDRGVVDGVSRDAAKLALIDSFVRFSREIGAVVCAEGIEDLVDLALLADLDVTLGQGYCLGRPGDGFQPALDDAVAVIRDATAGALRLGAAGEFRPGFVADRHLEIAAELLGDATSLDTLEPALEAIADALHADAVRLSSLTADARTLRTVAVCGGLEPSTSLELVNFPATAEVLRSGTAAQVLTSDPEADPNEVSELVADRRSSVLILPVKSGGEPIGLFEAFSSETRPWSRLELARARLFAYQLGLLLEKFSVRKPQLQLEQTTPLRAAS